MASNNIFISYRRDDSKHAAGRLVDRLGQAFSRNQLFLDIDNIEPGLDFVKVLSEKVHACDVVLAIIGPNWLDSRDDKGQRRLDNPKDFVRIEIEAAIARNIRLIPVLVDGAHMPSADDLPPTLRPLVTRNAVRLAHERFGSDAEDLTRALAKIVVPAKGISALSAGKDASWTARLPMAIAVIFGLGMFPLQFYLSFRSMASGDVTLRYVAGSTFALGVAFALARLYVRRENLDGFEVFFYWLGTVLTSFFGCYALFFLLYYGNAPVQDGGFGAGTVLLLGFGYTLLSGLALHLWWSRRRAA